MVTGVSEDDLPKGWNVKKLEDLCKEKPQSGGTPLTSIKEYYENGDIPWVITADLTNAGTYIDSTAKKITKKGLENSTARWFPKGTILFAMYGSIGKMSITRIPLTTNQAILGIAPNEKEIDLKYLYYFLECAKPSIIDIGRGGTQANVNAKIIKEFPISYPSLEIQRKIVIKLDDFFEHYNEIKRQHELEKTRVRRLMQAAIGKLIPNPEEGLPDGYIHDKLENLTSLISSGITPLGGAKNYLPGGDVAFIRSQNVLMNRLELAGVAYITNELNDKMKRTWLKKGDVLLNITGASIGRVATFDEDVRGNVNQHVCVLRPNQERIESKYLEYFIASPYIQNFIFSNEQGVTRQALNFTQIGDFEVTFPKNISEQRRIITKIVATNRHYADILHENIKKERTLGLLPNAVLRKAFTGGLLT